MIPRVLEPEAMETAEEVRQYDAMDHSAVNARFVDDFLSAHGPCRGGEILDVGTGTARIPIALATADSPGSRTGTGPVRDHARPGRRQYRRGRDSRRRITLHQGDASRCSTLWPRVFRRGHLQHDHSPYSRPEPPLEPMARLVAPGGTLMVRDLARPGIDRGSRPWSDTYAGGESPEAQALFEASLNAALTLEEIRGPGRRLGALASGRGDDLGSTLDLDLAATNLNGLACF